jgi:glutathione S-transferase
MLTLYYATGTCSLASHIVLEDSGAAYEAKRVDFSRGEQNSPEYLLVNPKGRVPALATDYGIISETPAILAFIAQSYPQSNLAAVNDPFQFAKANAFNNYLSSTVHVAHAHKRRGARWSDDPGVIQALTLKVPKNMADCFDLIEASMFTGPWVMGSVYTMCDPYLFTISSWLEADGVDPKKFPKVLDHRNRMAKRRSVKKVLAREHA